MGHPQPSSVVNRDAVTLPTGHSGRVGNDDRRRWTLEPAEVQISGSASSSSMRRRTGMARSSRAEDSRGAVVRLVHQPTGLEIEGEVPTGHYSRSEMRSRKDALIAELWPQLEKRVAKHLRIPGQ